MYEIDDAVKDIVGLSSHTDSPFDPGKVRSYVERMAGLIRSDRNAMEAWGDDPVRAIVYHTFRFEHYYAHLADYCAGMLQQPMTIDSTLEYMMAWDQAHPCV